MSEIKTVKIAEVAFNREYKPPEKSFTIYYFNLKTDDEMVGEFSTNGRNQTKFLVGESYSVEITEKSNRNGTYNWFDYSEAEKEKRKAGSSGGSGAPQKKGGWEPYVRPRKEIVQIIAQSSYEAALLACIKLNPLIASHTQISSVAKVFSDFICKSSGLNSTECMNGIKDPLKEANVKSIVLQSALKRAIEALSLEKLDVAKTTQGIITLTELIVKDINEITNTL